MFGVYLLAQLCSIATFWTLYLLARAIVGGQQAVLAVLLTMTVAAFSSPGVEFGPLVLARPLWALLLLHSWQIDRPGPAQRLVRLVDRSRLVAADDVRPRSACCCWSSDLRSRPQRGRRTLMSFDPLFALLVIVVLALPYLIWLIRADTLALPPWPAVADLQRDGRCTGRVLLGGLLLAIVRHRAAGAAQFAAGSSATGKKRRSSSGRRSIRWRAISSISSRWRPRSPAA